MKYFLEFVVSALVQHQEDVDIQQVDTPRATVFYINIHPADIGRLIGKNGKTITAIRNLMNAACKDNQRIQVEVVEDYEDEQP